MVDLPVLSFLPQVDELSCQPDDDLIKQIKAESNDLLRNRSCLERLVSVIDLTTLTGKDTKSSVEALIALALNPIEQDGIKCASVCVYPARVVDIANYLKSKNADFPIASVAAGFPSGQYRLETRLREIELAIQDGASEIDAVINRAAVMDGDWQLLFDEIRQMKQICADKATLKMILSVGELGSWTNVYKSSLIAMYAGADFVKQSTGKEEINATLESCFVMCKAIALFHDSKRRKVGFKAAGGIKTAEQGIQYMLLVQRLLGEEWTRPELFRIGASTLLEELRERLSQLC